MLQRGEDVLTMTLRQIWHSRRQRTDEVLDAVSRLPVRRRRSLQKRFERLPDDVGRSPAEAAGRSPQRATQRSGQTDRDLIVHSEIPAVHCNCNAMHCE
jgi:hypothetical protein